MFRSVLRTMDVPCAVLGTIPWIETIHDTMYRSPKDLMLVCRTRTRDGSRTGKRYFAFIKMEDGKYRKMRGRKGTIRYFATPLDAATEAALFYHMMSERWEKSRLISELDELTAKARSLRAEIEQLTGTRNALQARPYTTREDTTTDASTAHLMGIAQLPAYLKRMANAVVSVARH